MMISKALGALVALTLAVAGFGTAIALGGDYADHKTVICHVPPGNPGNAHTIEVDDHALKAHLGDNPEGLHGGDSYGPCDQTPTDTTPTETTPTETTPTETTPTETTPTTTQPPHVVTGAASVICDNHVYVLSGTVDGQAADSVTPATLPGSTTGTISVTVTRGDTSVRTSVTVLGDCDPVVSTVTPTTAAPTVSTSPPVATTPTSSTSTPKPKPKPKAKQPTPKPDNPPVVKRSTKKCPAPAYMLKGKCVRDYKGKPHGVVAGSG